ncbi:MAG: hypothetical protein ACLGIG_00070 [Actinomycetes bacterium]
MTADDVTGGVTGLEVELDALRAAAVALADVAAELVAVAAECGRGCLDDELADSALLDPVGAARAAASVAAALAGPRGLGAVAVEVEVHAARLALAVARYVVVERATATATALRREVQGHLLVAGAPALLGAGALWWAAADAAGADPVEELSEAVAAHPGLVDELVGSLPSALRTTAALVLGPLGLAVDGAVRARTGQTVLPRSLEQAAGAAGLLYAAGQPAVVRAGSLPADAPADVGDLIAGLTVADELVRAGGPSALVVATSVVRGRDGEPRTSHVVHLPGTHHWQVDPRDRAALDDLATNLELMAGEQSARVDSVRFALRAAGVDDGEPVMLVGHSQGGMVAVRAAAALGDEFRVTHVVTAGSPVSRMPLADGVSVLSLENRQDVVPRLDGGPNAPLADHVTVLFDAPAPTLAGEHELHAAYLPAAERLADSAHPALLAWDDGAQAFLLDDAERRAGTTATVTARVYRVTNADPP